MMSGVGGGVDVASNVGAAVAAVFASMFGVGILAAFLKRWWAQQDNAFAADQNARAEERGDGNARLEQLRLEHQLQIEQLRTEHQQQMEQLRTTADRRFTAIAKALREILLLLPEGPSRHDATEILLQLSIDEGSS